MFATALALILTASPPVILSNPQQYVRPGFPVWSGCIDAPIAATTYTLNAKTGTTDPAVFRWGSILVSTSTSATPFTCCLTMTTDTTIGDQTDAAAAKDVTDSNGPDGRGACYTVLPDARRDVVAIRGPMMTKPGRRFGVCNSPSKYSSELGHVFPPCRVDADCPTNGAPAGTTCDTSPSSRAEARTGVIVQCRSAETVDARICFDVER